MANELPERDDDANLKRMREYLETLAPALKLSDPDSYRVKHFIETGHVFRKGCCVRAKVESQRRRREDVRGL